MAQPARLTSGLLARKGQALPTGGFAHAKLDLVPLQPSVAKPEQHRCGTSLPREALLPDLSRPAPEPSRRPAPAQDDRVALTLRLDRARYTRLKISGGAARPLRTGAAAPRARRLSGGVRRGLRVPAQQHPARRELSPRRPGPQRRGPPGRLAQEATIKIAALAQRTVRGSSAGAVAHRTPSRLASHRPFASLH